EGFPFIQEPPSGDLQERVLIRHHDYDQCFQSVQLLQWNSQVKRSEERRVGKECRSRGWPDHERKKQRELCGVWRECADVKSAWVRDASRRQLTVRFFFFKQKTAYEIGLGIPAEPLFRSLKASHSFRNRLLVICKNAYLFATMIMTSVSSPFSCCSGIVRLNLM